MDPTSPVEYRHRQHPTVPGHILVQWRPTTGDDQRWRYAGWVRTVPEASRLAENHARERGWR